MKLGMVFPGQGSQSVGMLADLIDVYPGVKVLCDKASAILHYDVWDLIQYDKDKQLNETYYTQPILLTVSYAIWELLMEKNFKPVLLAGHSLGEYTALIAANAISFTDGLRLVAKRGKFMQEAVPNETGALAAIIGLNQEAILTICKEAADGQVLSPANFNSTEQVVIAGETNAILRAINLAKKANAKLAKRLPVSVPSHCALMIPAAKKLAVELETIEIKKPTIPVINNVDVKEYSTPSSIREGLIKQLYSPVRWVEIINYFQQQNVGTIIECGPGKVLTNLNTRIVKEINCFNTAKLPDINNLFLQNAIYH